MGKYWWLFALSFILLCLAGLLHYVHFLIFRDVHHIFIYMLGDLAFLPLEILIVVIVIERLLSNREKEAMLQKLNMVVGAFFSEVGNRLLRDLLNGFNSKKDICEVCNVKIDWRHGDFKNAIIFASHLQDKPDFSKIDPETLKKFLIQKRAFLLRLLENPNLLEHERFTDLLWATFHLTEELEARESFINLPENDVQHLCSDIQRVYSLLVREWIYYAEHLKTSYPFLYSLVVRTHPFLERPSAVIG